MHLCASLAISRLWVLWPCLRGSFVADPVSISCGSACTVTVVHELALPPLQLEPAEAAQVAVAILAVWAAGFGIRELIRVVRNTDKSAVEEE